MSFGFGVGDFIAVIELAKKIRKDFVDAPSQFKDISDELRSLSIVLEDVDVVLSAPDLTNEQKTQLREIADGCLNVLKTLEQTLDKYGELKPVSGSVGNRAKRLWKRLKWEPDDIGELRTRIVANIIFLNTFQGNIASQISLATKDGVDRLHERQDNREYREERRTILDWLTPVDYAPQQSDFFSRRQEGTGRWLLESPEFHEWLDPDEQTTLFCPGIPGAGKTILTSIVVDSLRTKFQKDLSIGIAYLYCNFRRQHEQKSEDLVASLLKQLIQEQASVPDSVKTLYTQHKDSRKQLSLEDISRALHSVITTYSKVYVVVDALDECQLANGCRSRFLSNIFDLQAKTKIKLFATSRPILDIEKEFKGCISLEILASDEDVARFLDGHISQLPTFILSKPKLQEEIKAEIVKAAEGMFLLAQLYLSSLEDKTTPKAIKTTLKRFQKQSQGSSQNGKLEVLSSAYEQAMERINGQKKGFKLLANEVLSWITCARRPLNTSELQHAIAVEIDEPEFDEDNLPDLEDMVSVCAGLVTIDEEGDIIRLVHYTTQEYFEQTQSNWFPDAEANVTRICVTYLSFRAFDRGVCQTDEELEERFLSNPFYKYAAENWGYHTCKVSTLNQAVYQAVIGFLESESRVNAAIQVLFIANMHHVGRNYSQNYPRSMTGLHLTTYFGVDTAARLLLETGKTDVNSKDSYSLAPLTWAAALGHATFAELLLDTGKANVNVEDAGGNTPLLSAAGNGFKDVVEVLLQHGAELELEDASGGSPLPIAAENGHEAIVEMLLERGAKLDSENDIGESALAASAANGHEAVVKLLLKRGAQLEVRDGWKGCTPLLRAIERRRPAVVRLLLERGAELEGNNRSSESTLSTSAVNGHEAIVELLLERGGQLPVVDGWDYTPLLDILGNGSRAVDELLDKQRADTDAKSGSGWIAVQLAALKRWEDMEQYLKAHAVLLDN